MAEAVIFDLDGTLADSELAHERALRAAAETRGMTFTHEYFRERCVGVGESGCFRMVAREHGVELEPGVLEELISKKLGCFREAVPDGGVVAQPGAVELVRACRAVMPVALCTGSSRESLEIMLGAIGLADAFGVVVTSSDVPAPKPDPAGYLLAASRLGLGPGACVAVEDSPTGVEAAARAGVRVIGVAHSFPGERLVGADLVVARIGEITAEMLRGF